MANTFAYIRTGLGNVDGEMLTMEEQERRIASYAAKKRLLIHEWFRDREIQATVPMNKRLQGAALLEVAKHGDIIITHSPGRMFGTAGDALECFLHWTKHKIGVHFVSLGGDILSKHGKVLYQFLDSIAEEERRTRAEYISRTKRVLRGEGKFPGGRIPFGFMRDEAGHIKYDPAQQKAVLFIIEKHVEGMSNRWISNALKKDFNIKLSYNSVKRVIERSKEQGDIGKVYELL